MEYVHLEVGKDITALAGLFRRLEELGWEREGGEVLCVIGTSTVESSCCGGGVCGYAIVPGYILKWKERENNEGLAVSEVEPISDRAAQREIARTIRETEHIQNVTFW